MRRLFGTAVLAAAVLSGSYARAKDESVARSIAFDLALASWAAGACSAVMKGDPDAVVRWTAVIIADFDNDVPAASAMIKSVAEDIPKAAEDSLTKVGWAQFCASVWSGYGDDGIQRPGLVHKSP